MLAAIAQGKLRTNPRLVVTRWDDLNADVRDSLRELRTDPDWFGVAAVPRAAESFKAIDNRTAAVLAELRTPAFLPDDARTYLLGNGSQLFLRLVLDDFLQLEAKGAFVGGPDALSLLPQNAFGANGAGALAALSTAAMSHAAMLRTSSVRAVSERLYAFNSAPETPRLRAQFSNASNIARVLRLAAPTSLAHLIAERWRSPQPFDEASWWTFEMWGLAVVPNEGLRFKVYLSPTIDALARAIDLAIPILKRHACPVFKIGGGLHQLLRPDKFVAYFFNQRQMRETASDLAVALAALPGQGVPFSGPVNHTTIVSWAIDPPSDAHPLAWQGRDSWRTWVARRIARYILIARHYATSPVKPWEFARIRVKLDGVDTGDWTPADGEWNHNGELPDSGTM